MEQEFAQFAERTSCIQCGGKQLRELSSGLFNQGLVQQFIAADPWGEHPTPFLVGRRWSYVTSGATPACRPSAARSSQPEWNERRFTRWMSQEPIASFEKGPKTPARLLGHGASHAMHVLRLEALTRDVRGAAPVRVLDFGCGYGQFLSMCSLFGFDAIGVDRSTAKNVLE